MHNKQNNYLHQYIFFIYSADKIIIIAFLCVNCDLWWFFSLNYNLKNILLFTIWSDRPISTDVCHVSEVCSFSASHLKQTEGRWLQQGWSPPLPASLSAVWKCKSQPNSPAIRNTPTYLRDIKEYINIDTTKGSCIQKEHCEVTWILRKRGLA